MLKVNTKLTPKNKTTANRGKQAIKWIVIHNTATQASASANASYFAGRYVGASAHYFLDGTDCFQSVLDKDIAWHCGAKSYRNTTCRNSNSIGIEVCSNGVFNEAEIVMLRTLVRELMIKYAIPASHVIRHNDVTGKSCPAHYVNDVRWNALKKRITDPPKPVAKKPVAKPVAKKPVKLNMPVLKEGDHGAYVKNLQVALNKKLTGPDLKVDGGFGAKTKAAVIKFQGRVGLAKDGVVGPKTWDKLGY